MGGRGSFGTSRACATASFSASFTPFLKAFSPLPKSPISCEILPRPPNRIRTIKRTTIQCHKEKEPTVRLSCSLSGCWKHYHRCPHIGQRRGPLLGSVAVC